jgi:hypothetical protein
MEMAFAGLHQLCAPMLDRAQALPGPQRVALRTAFGLSTGPVPDRFLVGLAVAGLLSETAAECPPAPSLNGETHRSDAPVSSQPG